MSDDINARVESAVERLGARADAHMLRGLLSWWRDATSRYGANSGPARGVLLDMVREAWHAPRSGTYPPRVEGADWSVGGFVPGDDGACVFAYGASELLALVAALVHAVEAAPS